MNGHDMSDMQSAPNAAAQPFDLQFIDTMIHHHDGALDMAKDILTKTQRQELKTFAQKIIDDQTKEIAMMRDWREKWYAGKPSALNMELPGMKMSESAEDRVADADQEFLRMMIEHHEGALLMGEAAIKRGEHPEIKQLGEDVIKAQRSEIEKMKAWQEEWAAK
jgi:uncharacterized protein (DUF305 family)